MATELYYDNIAITLGTAITTTPVAGTIETNWSFTFPSGTMPIAPSSTNGQYRLLVDSEVIIWTAGTVTAGTTVANQTVVRGADNTTPLTHTAGVAVSFDITSTSLSNNVQLSPSSAQTGNINVTGTVSGSIVNNGGAIYDVRTYGAKFDVKTVTDAAMAASVATLTSATANFTANDVGKLIQVLSGTTQVGTGTITAYTDSATVTLSFTNGTTAYTGATATYGTDDRVAIQNTLNQIVNGGIVQLPAGTCFVSTAGHPDNSGYLTGLYVQSGTKFRGLSEQATTIMLAPAQPTGCYGILNRHIAAGGDTAIVFEDFMYYGNSEGQGAVATIVGQFGIFIMRTYQCSFLRVHVKNIRASANSGAGEGFSFETQLGADTTYVDCIASATVANAGAAFSADNHTDARWIGCVSHGSTAGQGFTHNTCNNLQYLSCRSFSQGSYGFNSEVSNNISYSGCIAGSTSTNAVTYPYAANTVLSNTSADYVLNQGDQITLTGCQSRGGSYGFLLTGMNRSIIAGCFVTSHSTNGVNFYDAQSSENLTMQGNIFYGNGSDYSIYINGAPANTNASGPAATVPAIPATGVDITNPYGVDCIVNVVGGTVTGIFVDDAGMGFGTNQPFAVPARSLIKITYSVAPTWYWILM